MNGKLPFESIQCRLSTLSPLHLGTGDEYYPTHYVIHEGYLHALGDTQLARALGPAGLTQLAELAANGDDRSLRQIQAFIHGKAEQLIPEATHSIWVNPGIERQYAERVGRAAQRENNRTIHNNLAIARTFRNPHNHQPVLTGSSIKGALRTAVLDQLNGGQTTRDKDHHLQQRLLDTGGKIDRDPFYLLRVSDGTYHHPEGLLPGEIWFAVSRRRKPVQGRTASNLNTRLECIGPWRSRCFSFELRLQDPGLRHPHLPGGYPADWKNLAKTANRYYLPKLRDELIQLGLQAGYLDKQWISTCKQLLESELGQALDRNDAFLLHLGKHTGAQDKTLEGARSIKILGGKGQKPTFRQETTEVRLAARDTGDMQHLLPFGWVLVERTDRPLNATAELITAQAQDARKRLPIEQQWSERRLQAQQERERREQEAQEQAQRKAQEEQAERERQAELAKAPPEIQALEQFRTVLENDQASRDKGMGAPLAEPMRALTDQALQWPPEYRQQARELVGLALKHMGVDRKKNKKAKALWASLGEGS
ncbi:MAG: hypothetical protein CMI01_06410 [Oceanospirillaceae bacterium]|nr:hypothetical protein [Oceanospirillaceae bacterium]